MLFDVSFRSFSDTTIWLQIKKTWPSFWQQNSSGKLLKAKLWSLDLDNLKSTHEEADVAHDSPHASL
jgi:hypothetical protein